MKSNRRITASAGVAAVGGQELARKRPLQKMAFIGCRKVVVLLLRIATISIFISVSGQSENTTPIRSKFNVQSSRFL